MSIILYGIPNCDQVKKARAWLSEHAVGCEFHDYKKAGVSADLITYWLRNSSVNWEILLNRRGTTWRKLCESEQAEVIDEVSAVAAMVQQPSLIKRPVLAIQSNEKIEIIIGFSEEKYQLYFPD